MISPRTRRRPPQARTARAGAPQAQARAARRRTRRSAQRRSTRRTPAGFARATASAPDGSAGAPRAARRPARRARRRRRCSRRGRAQPRPRGRPGPDEMDDGRIARAGSGRRRPRRTAHQRARHHPGEQDEPDGARSVRLERDDAQRDERGPLRCMEASPRQLRATKRGVLPELATAVNRPPTPPLRAHEPRISAGTCAVQGQPGAQPCSPPRRRLLRDCSGCRGSRLGEHGAEELPGVRLPRRRPRPPACRSRSPRRLPRRPPGRDRRPSPPA